MMKNHNVLLFGVQHQYISNMSSLIRMRLANCAFLA